jgi:hypothetical protein
MKLELLTNATVVDDAIRFIALKSKEKEKIKSAIEDDKEESDEHDYGEHWLEKEREEETHEIAAITTNEVF